MKKEVYSVDLQVLKSLLDANPSGTPTLPPLEQLVWLQKQDQILVPTGLDQEEFDALFQILQLIHVLRVGLTVGGHVAVRCLPMSEASDQQR